MSSSPDLGEDEETRIWGNLVIPVNVTLTAPNSGALMQEKKNICTRTCLGDDCNRVELSRGQ